ncbi:MAG: MoaD/ThiS family protein [Pseudomonadota bacterium]
MKVTVKIIGGQEIPPGVHADAEGTVECELGVGATLAEALKLLNIPYDVLTLVDSLSVPQSERGQKQLDEGCEVVVFPPLSGG